MQKDRVVDKISSVNFDPKRNNNSIVVGDISYTIIYDKNGNVLQKINGGYLDIGIIDTIKDLFVNFIGAVVFSIFGYIYSISNEKNHLIANLVPQKGTRKLPESVQKEINNFKKKRNIKAK